MFSSVSWPAFIEFIFTVVFFYYAVVLILFYRLELSQVLTKFTSLRKVKHSIENNATTVVSNEKKADESHSSTSLPTQEDQDKITISDADISNIYLELEEAIVIAKEKKYARQELLTSLQLIVSKCTNCAGTDLSKTINSQIQSHLSINFLEALDAQEFSQIWFK